jgi:splicing factor 1
MKRKHAEVTVQSHPYVTAANDIGYLPQKRTTSRWGPTNNKVLGLDMPTALTSLMTPEQIDAYAINFRITEITQELHLNRIPTKRQRAPSPPPTYDNTGRRTNTREARYKKKLEDERHGLVEKAMKFIPEFKPPAGYRRLPPKTEEKIYIPVNDYPEINFIGLLLGPRGNSLKQMEVESGAKIFIRGKGSVKEGKRASANHNLEEDLHCVIMAKTEYQVATAVSLIENIIETAASVPESENEYKKQQLRDIAKENGTFRDDERQVCLKCGEVGHRKYNCPRIDNFRANVTCYRCNQTGHINRDCKVDLGQQTQVHGGAIDQEYRNFMAELGMGGSGIGYDQPMAHIKSIQPAPVVTPQAVQQQFGYLPEAPGSSSLQSLGPPPASCLGPPPSLTMLSGGQFQSNYSGAHLSTENSIPPTPFYVPPRPPLS